MSYFCDKNVVYVYTNPCYHCTLMKRPDEIREALANFGGVNRRFTKVGEVNGVTIIDDYGHHPTEVKTTLQALKECWPDRRKVVVFQPHRYSRTQALLADFTHSFNNSDVLLVLPIYAASEEPIAGVSAQIMVDGIRAHGHRSVVYLDGFTACVDHLTDFLRPGDLLLTLGAGDVYKIGEMVLEKLGA